jgi:hypothetical protein
MNCIDAIEGVAKNIIKDLHKTFRQFNLDDTEYARTVKSVIEGTSVFVEKNSEISHTPEILENILYQYSKDLWIATINQPDQEKSIETNDYIDYYYNHIYQFGNYPE